MFILLLKFGPNKARAAELMEGHNRWLRQGFDDDVFLLAGSLTPGLGGGILARCADRAEVEARLQADPFVVEAVVDAEILELAPVKADARLDFLLGEAA